MPRGGAATAMPRSTRRGTRSFRDSASGWHKARQAGKETDRRPVAALVQQGLSGGVGPGGAPSQESGLVQHAASAITAPDTDQLPVYWQFHEAVARAQLTEWLPTGRHLLVDVSGPRAPAAELAARAGHTVVRVLDAGPGQRQGGLAGRAALPKGGPGGWVPPERRAGGARGGGPPGQYGRMPRLPGDPPRRAGLGPGSGPAAGAGRAAGSVKAAA